MVSGRTRLYKFSFKFAIQNGMLDPSRRFSALKPRFRSAANVAYRERQLVEIQVIQTAGTGSSYAALFSLQYQDASPNPDRATTNVKARTEFNRIADQNLELLTNL